MSMAKSTAIPLISRGLLAVVVGVFSLAWPGVTVRAIAVAFALYALAAAGVDVMRAFNSDRVGPVAGYLLLAALSLAAAFGGAPTRPFGSFKSMPNLPRRSLAMPARASPHPALRTPGGPFPV
ncbi:DUF308 domain-containing protein [Streptomyces sp. NPDC056653]|uniref:DUF308 domain-containing protein n=1 Tax=Streptomyces sp. NPDC056653 TaxID=3345894 RepID=UPI0036D1EE25